MSFACRSPQSRSVRPHAPPRGGSVERGRALELFHDFLPLFDNPHNRVAGLAARRLVNLFEHFFEPRQVFFGSVSFFKRSFEALRLGSLGHFGQGSENLLFGEIDVF
jgi:hypothetical protein